MKATTIMETYGSVCSQIGELRAALLIANRAGDLETYRAATKQITRRLRQATKMEQWLGNILHKFDNDKQP